MAARRLQIGTETVDVGPMVESHDVEAAARSLEQHGYALLRQAIPAALVRAAGERIAAELEAEGWLRPGSDAVELLAAEDTRGGMLSTPAAHVLANEPAVRRCMQGPEIFAVFDELFGEPSVSLDFKWFRGIRGGSPGSAHMGTHAAPPHPTLIIS